MMLAIFAAMTLTFGLQFWGELRWATGASIFALMLGLALFLWEVYDPQRGFAMPWLNVEGGLQTTTQVPA